jgi:hypothetical protein
MSAHAVLEHHEHAEHIAEHGAKHAALLVAILAALLALMEVQVKHAEIAVEENSIAASDAWNQYQAKSVRQATAHDLELMTESLDPPTQPDVAARRASVLKTLRSDQEHYAKDPKDGKDAIAERARGFEEAREHALHRDHTFDNASAALELGIVLATASAITSSKMLIRLALGLGALGLLLGALGFVAPQWGTF